MPSLPPPPLPDRMVLAPRMPQPVTGRLPLQGITLLAVEDSRFASDALRLLSLRSGARLRRTGTLEQARAHLRVYRPDVVLIDLGLPDGRGEDLIRQLAATPARPVLLGMSGDPDGRGLALGGGCRRFRGKAAGRAGRLPAGDPVTSAGPGRGWLAEGEVIADPAALHDDLAQAVRALDACPAVEQRLYLAGFLSGLGRQNRDAALVEATRDLVLPDIGAGRLARLLDERLSESAPFRPGAP
ncbi:response regulator [Rhodobacter sp.]